MLTLIGEFLISNLGVPCILFLRRGKLHVILLQINITLCTVLSTTLLVVIVPVFMVDCDCLGSSNVFLVLCQSIDNIGPESLIILAKKYGPRTKFSR